MVNDEQIAEFHRAVWAVLDGSDTSELTLQKIVEMANPAFEYDKTKKFTRGGEGLVVWAKHVHLRKKQFVIKIANQEVQAGKKSKSRFFRGAAYMWMLHRKLLWGVPDVVDANFDYGFYVMEYVHGVPLEKFCKKANELDNIKMFLQLLDIVGVIHESAIVHRDLKPSNIYVAEHPITRLLSPVVLDFGIAKKKEDASDNLTGMGFSMGSRPWVAPEQWDDSAEADYRSDIYSLGSIFYGMLTYLKRDRFPRDNGEAEQRYNPDEDFPHDLLEGKFLTVFLGARGNINQRYQTINQFKKAVRIAAGLSREDMLYLSPITGIRERIPQEEKQKLDENIEEIGLHDDDESEIMIEEDFSDYPVVVDGREDNDDSWIVDDKSDELETINLKEFLGDVPDAPLIIAMIKFAKNVSSRKNYEIGE